MSTTGLLPTFLGIGAPKAGTTWLHNLLDAHPDVAMSRHRKEVHYFDHHFTKGQDWYRGFFPDRQPRPRAIGEYTTSYLYDLDVPLRVKTVPTIERFVLIVRNPVDRAVSHYRFRQRQDHRTETFSSFLDRVPHAIEWGCYARHLRRWLEVFDQDRFLILVFEDAVPDAERTQAALARHLRIPAGGFPSGPDQPANEGFVPRHGRLYGAAVRQARWMRRHELDPLLTLAKRTGLVRGLKRPAPGATVPVLSAHERTQMWDHFEDDVQDLEGITGLNLSAWRPDPSPGGEVSRHPTTNTPMTSEQED